MKGKLIVIEGNNASGKRTQAKLLVQRLRKEGRKVIGIGFPRYKTAVGKIIGSYLRGEFGDVDTISPYLAASLYALDRIAEKPAIDAWLKKGFIVVTDRYVESNMAFQAAKLASLNAKKKLIGYVNEIEYIVGKLPKPDLILYLDVPLTLASQLHEKKESRSYIGKKKDIHERNQRYLTEVEKVYQSLAKKNKWVNIACIEKDTLLSKTEIADNIFKRVRKAYAH